MAARLVLDEQRCIGCFACEIACSTENELGVGNTWIHMNPEGPRMQNGTLMLAFRLRLDDGCTLCASRLAKKLQPSCVQHCMAHCLSVEG